MRAARLAKRDTFPMLTPGSTDAGAAPTGRPDRRNGWIYLAIVLWGTAVTAGAAELWRYKLTPGETPAPAPQIWPANSNIPAHPGKPLLLMVAHPQCSCTRASLNELSRLIARFEKLDNPPVLYLSVIPTGGERGDLIDGPVLRTASAIKGLNVVIDADGEFADRLGAKTSGHTLLYGADGKLLYSGGITNARAHEGDAAGQNAIVAALYGKAQGTKDAPVFGCGLHSPGVRS
jgi:hypothetical protein